MVKVEILERFNTSMGLALIAKTKHDLSVGDTITDGEKKFKIKGFPTSPGASPQFWETGVIGIVVERLG